MYPLVRELAAAAAPHRVPVAVTCRVLGLARQPYYRWLACPVTDSELAEACWADALFDAHRDDPEFGHRFLLDEARAAGEAMAERTAWRICRDNSWWSAFGKRRGRGKNAKAGPPVHDDLVRRNLTADRPNPVVAHGHHRARDRRGQAVSVRGQGRLLGPHRGLLHRRPDEVPSRGGRAGVRRRPPQPHCGMHPALRPRIAIPVPQGRRRPHRHGLAGSMGRVGAAGDNAAMESFFALLQKNVLDRRTWTTRQEWRIAIVTWIERTYHRRRRQRRLGRLTPVEYATIMTPPAALAA